MKLGLGCQLVELLYRQDLDWVGWEVCDEHVDYQEAHQRVNGVFFVALAGETTQDAKVPASSEPMKNSNQLEELTAAKVESGIGATWEDKAWTGDPY